MKTLTINNQQTYFAIRSFFSDRNINQYVIDKYHLEKKLIIKQSLLADQQQQQFLLHLKYHKFFRWLESGLEDVVFWERPELYPALVADFKNLTADIKFQYIAPIEARGFILGGIFAGELNLPQYLIRKYKPWFDNFPGEKVEFINWRKEKEKLFVFDKKLAGSSVLIVDDLLDTGNSLTASVKALEKVGMEISGAFYLADARVDDQEDNFNFPILSLVKTSAV